MAPAAVVVLDTDEPMEPTEEQLREYAEFLGIDPVKEKHLMWIAQEGVMAPVPVPWKMCTQEGDDSYFYFNMETGESVWDHPCDEKYQEMLKICRMNGDSAPDAAEQDARARAALKFDTLTQIGGAMGSSVGDSSDEAQRPEVDSDDDDSISESSCDEAPPTPRALVTVDEAKNDFDISIEDSLDLDCKCDHVECVTPTPRILEREKAASPYTVAGKQTALPDEGSTGESSLEAAPARELSSPRRAADDNASGGRELVPSGRKDASENNAIDLLTSIQADISSVLDTLGQLQKTREEQRVNLTSLRDCL